MDHFRGHLPPQMSAMPQPSQVGDGMLNLPPDMLPPQQQQQHPDSLSSAMLRGMPPSGMGGAYNHPTSNPSMMANQPGMQMGSSLNPMASGGHVGSLNMHQLQQLNAQIRAYKILARNQPLNDMLMCAVQGKRLPTQMAMSGGGTTMTAGQPMTAGPPMTAGLSQPNFSGIPANPPSSITFSQPQRVASSTALNSPGGSSAGVSSQVNSPAASLQPQVSQGGMESPGTPVTATVVSSLSQQQSSTIHSELKAMNNSMAPNVSITSSNSPLPISAPPTNTVPTISIPASTSNAMEGVSSSTSSSSSSSQENSQDTTTTTTVSTAQQQPQQQQMISKMAPPVKQVKIIPYNKPAGIDPVILLKEREIRYVHVYLVGMCSSKCVRPIA